MLSTRENKKPVSKISSLRRVSFNDYPRYHSNCAAIAYTTSDSGKSYGSGVVCLNGAAARSGQKGDHIIIMAYANMTPGEIKAHRPKVVFVGGRNEIIRVAGYEKHGELR